MTIFIDLDETLIHAIPLRSNPGRLRRRIEVGEGNEREVFAVALRPLAHQMLEDCRRLAQTILLTTATMDYALAMNREFKFGFKEMGKNGDNEILARFHLYADGVGVDNAPRRRNIFPDSLLIDNLPSDSDSSTTKRELLGLSATSPRYISIREFNGKDPKRFSEIEWPQILRKIQYYS